jgi:murein DD-endopeptidase MepM/ murein hydrolase activator NlpD
LVQVARGDTLAAIFKRLGLSPAELHALVATSEHGTMLARIRPGQELEISLDPQGKLAALDYRMDAISTLAMRREGAVFRSELVRPAVETRYATAAGTINHSLFLAGQAAGLSDQLTMQLVEIFGWDVDFALDIRSGDQLAVVYEELYAHGEKVADGDIVAAEFVNRGRTIRALRYTDSQGHTAYYTPDGHSMRRTFLRTPVRFSRISSRFQRKRWHPKLHRVRAHRGVDYAAPQGTPVKATGDGTISSLGRKGGYGKTIILRHGNGYTTLYAHLSRYRRGLRVGARVKQGQVIGHVGRTGLATGPHLHYEFRVRGVHRNPLTISLPKSAPIAATYRDDFARHTRPLLAQLEAVSRLQLAQGNGE